MSKPILQLQNEANWLPLWNYSQSAVTLPGDPDSTAPLAPIIVPFLLDEHIIAISATSSTAKPFWRFGARIAKKSQRGLSLAVLLM